MDKRNYRVTITDEVSPPGEPVVTLRVPKCGKVTFRRVNPNKSLSAEMSLPLERANELRTMGYEVEELKPKAAPKPKPKADDEEAS